MPRGGRGKGRRLANSAEFQNQQQSTNLNVNAFLHLLRKEFNTPKLQKPTKDTTD